MKKEARQNIDTWILNNEFLLEIVLTGEKFLFTTALHEGILWLAGRNTQLFWLVNISRHNYIITTWFLFSRLIWNRFVYHRFRFDYVTFGCSAVKEWSGKGTPGGSTPFGRVFTEAGLTFRLNQLVPASPLGIWNCNFIYIYIYMWVVMFFFITEIKCLRRRNLKPTTWKFRQMLLNFIARSILYLQVFSS